MGKYEREITKEQYERAMKYNGLIPDEDRGDIFTISELWGYGVYLPTAFERDGKYFVSFELGSSCD